LRKFVSYRRQYGSGGSSQAIYFSGGPVDEAHGLFGVIQVPEPATVALVALAHHDGRSRAAPRGDLIE
jgi:hypothetical protein